MAKRRIEKAKATLTKLEALPMLGISAVVIAVLGIFIPMLWTAAIVLGGVAVFKREKYIVLGVVGILLGLFDVIVPLLGFTLPIG